MIAKKSRDILNYSPILRGIERATIARLDPVELETILHSLDVASRTFADSVKLWNQAMPNALVTENGIKGLREQFVYYSNRTDQLRERLEGVRHLAIVIDEEVQS